MGTTNTTTTTIVFANKLCRYKNKLREVSEFHKNVKKINYSTNDSRQDEDH